MSKLTELLEGVEVKWKTLGEVTNVLRGKRLTRDMLTLQEKYPVFHGGLEPLGFYSNSNRPANTVMIVNVGASAGTVGYSDVEFWSSDGCFCIEHSKVLYNKFLYYFLIGEQHFLKSKVRVAGIPTLDNFVVEKLQIPIPCPKNPIKSLEIQTEIVRILDKFTEHEAELVAELQKRRMQYKYYSTLLFDNVSKSDLHSIEEVCQVKKGATPIQKATPGEYPMVVTTSERKSCETYQFDAKAVCIPLVSSRGHGVASLNQVYYQEGKFALGNILCAIIPKNENKVCSKYLYYYFQRTKDYTLVPLMKGGANVALRTNDIEKIKVPIPSLEEQKRIVRILDKFDTLTTSMSEGLPKEIALRKKQYEYYRDRLLTFK